jgi:hypothetical protein
MSGAHYFAATFRFRLRGFVGGNEATKATPRPTHFASAFWGERER